MYIKRHWGMVRHGLAALTFALALASTNVAGATAISSLAGEIPISLASDTVDAGHNDRTLDTGIVFGRGSGARYSANLWPPVFSVCRIEQCALTSSVLEETDSLARTSISALATSMKLRLSSLNIAGSLTWSKLIVFTSTSINVRLPIN
jgi:hypothetical protein